LTITEVPITFVERERGASKMTTSIVLEAMARVTGWGLRGLPTRWSKPVPVVEAPTEGTVGSGA
jgi:dolichol-phosphate mannosyltransferase